MTVQSFDGETEAILKDKVEGFPNPNEDVLGEISNFNWLWPIFEAKCFETDAKVAKIKSLTASKFPNGNWKCARLKCAHEHFFARYIDLDGNPSQQLNDLLKEKNEKRPEHSRLSCFIVAGLKSDTGDDSWIVGMALIALRLRNRLFHGRKGEVGFEGQLDNFVHANIFLRTAIQAYQA